MNETLKILYTFLLLSLNLNAQYGIEWEKKYGDLFHSESIIDILNDNNDIVMVGFTESGTYGNKDVWVVKTDSNGIVNWNYSFGGNFDEIGYSIKKTLDGGYIIGASSNSLSYDVSNNYGDWDFWVFKITKDGVLEWEKNFGGTDYDLTTEIIVTSDNNYILLGQTLSDDVDIVNSYYGADIFVLKMDSLGNQIWTKNYGGSGGDYPKSIIETQNGYLIAAATNSYDYDITSSFGWSSDIWVVEIDFNGSLIWEKSFGGSSFDSPAKIINSSEGGFTILAQTNSTDGDLASLGNSFYWVFKIDSIGNIEWSFSLVGASASWGSPTDIIQKSNSNYVLTGSTDSLYGDFNANYGYEDIWIIEIDSNGNLISKQNFGGSGDDSKSILILDDFENIIFSCTSFSDDYDISDFSTLNCWLVKLKKISGNVRGEIFFDKNNDCIFNNSDTIIPNLTLKIRNNTNNYVTYTNSNINGQYYTEMDTVSHSLIAIKSPYLESSTCSLDTLTAQLSFINISDTINFYLTPTVLCPHLDIDISTPLLRRCDSSNYYISYCNNGTETAQNAYIEIEFDPLLQVSSSTIPWTTVIGNTYTFPIGNVAIFDCETFSVDVTVACDSITFVGQVLCTEAHIYPDSFCLQTPTWSGAELQARAECLGTDSVAFVLKNIGIGNMGGDVPVIVIEDVILRIDTMINLNSGDSLKWIIPTNGISQRIIAEQPLSHPFKTFTTDAVHLCNTSGLVSPGPVIDSTTTAYPNDEEAPYIAIDCQPLIGAYDPNDKTVYPTGVSSQHFISEKTELEYKIRFQNTGTDTAFTVVITDSISSFLDITSIRPGASSHPYQFDIFGTGVLKFTFNNILLADSFVNEPASHGFVQYKIAQKEGNQVGDEILNNADIFFDFNLPVRTNTAFSKIGGIFLDTLLLSRINLLIS